MKRALSALWLLLILTAVSTGPGIAWADSSACGFTIHEDDPIPGAPDAPGGDTVLYGDPDDAITGNRGPSANDITPPFTNALNGDVDDSGDDVDDWYLLMMLLLDLGLI